MLLNLVKIGVLNQNGTLSEFSIFLHHISFLSLHSFGDIEYYIKADKKGTIKIYDEWQEEWK